MAIDGLPPEMPTIADAGSATPAGRRRALIRLGLAVGAAYIAPTVLSIDRSARAQGPSCAKNPTKC